MRCTLFLPALLLLAMLPVSAAHAQAQLLSGMQPDTDTVTVDKDNINNLIDTLESESEREQFIDNLKALARAEEAQHVAQEESQSETNENGQEGTTSNAQNSDTSENENAPSGEKAEKITETLGVDEAFEGALGSYNTFLARNDLAASLVGKSILTAATVFIAAVLVFLIRKGSFALRERIFILKRRFNITHDRFRLYNRLLRYSGYWITAALSVYSLGIIWDITNFSFLQSDLLGDLVEVVFSIILITIIAAAIWEVISVSVEYAMQRSTSLGPNSARLRTLLPILHNVLFVAFLVLFTLVMLSELGINIVPLLAGAGIVGIAVGFGAQTMVKDFLTGFVIILEDLVQVGDVARVGGKAGLVEKITIRKIQLRDLDGTVYTVPFSEISIVENLTKHYSFYLMDVGIAYRENTDQVIGYLKEIDEDMRNDEEFKDLILEPIHILGVDAFADSAVIIKARIKTLPIKQWDVGREFNRRMKIKFDEMGVEIPFPHQTIYFGIDKDGKAPPAPIHIDNAEILEDSSKKSTKKKTDKKSDSKSSAKTADKKK